MAEKLLSIDRLAFGGGGVGRLDGKVCFVPFSCPGDELKVSVTTEKRSYLTAAIRKIVTPGQWRISPACSLFGTCGGCDWQHVEYGEQCSAKRQILADALWRGSRVEGDRVLQPIPSPRQYGYRSRVQFKLFAADGLLRIGFFRQGSHYVIDAPEGCPIALPEINEALRSFRAVLSGHPEAGRIPQINVDCGDSGVLATVHYIGDRKRALSDFLLSRREDLQPLSGLYLQTGRKSTISRIYGDELLEYRLPSERGELTLGYRAGGFSQVNREQNRAMLEIVRSMVPSDRTQHLLDLYCGNGNFSLPLSGEVASVTGIEDYPDSIAAAQENAARNHVTNARYICGDAARTTRTLAAEGTRFDTVLIDPPRTGAPETVRELGHLEPSRIIYISCDPATLGRDCGLLAGLGYRVTSSVPVDMFPQTYHLESVTLLERCHTR